MNIGVNFRFYYLTLAAFYLSYFPSEGFANCEMPEIISSKVIFSESCNLALYSSNRSGRVRPYRLEISEQTKWQSYALGIENKESEDYFARDLSSDCSQVALVGDSNGNEHYRVYLFDIQNRTLTKISSDDVLDSGNPNFSPKGDLLAFTADRKLFVYNLAARKIIQEFSANYKILNFAWAQTNQRIFIQDEGGSIYSQDLITAKREELFVLPKKSYSSSFLKSYADRLYFISDHDSDFSQIYKLDLESKNVSRVLPEDADQSDPQLIGDKLYYKSSIAGKLCLKSISPGGPSTNVICDGVVYSYALFKDRLLALYSNYNSPTSIYQYSASGMLSEKLGLDKDKNLTPPIALGSEALPNFLFTPQSKTDSVVIWLHGGPYENVSPRYNPFIANLLNANHAVLAVNYPGSTGAGNSYELRGFEKKEILAKQISGIEDVLADFKKQNPQFTKFDIFSISYGSTVAHLLREKNPKFFGSLLDFSGKTDFTLDEINKIKFSALGKTLFMYGEEDYFASLAERKLLIDRYVREAGASVRKYSKESHVIRDLKNNQQVCNEIIEFLNR